MSLRHASSLSPAAIPALLALPAVGLMAFSIPGGCHAADGVPQLGELELPAGFEISLVTDQVPGARQMALGANGTLFVGSLREGKVYAVLDPDGDYVANEVVVIDDDLTIPSGVAFRDGDLYVGALNRILRYDDVEKRVRAQLQPEVVTDALPSETHHGWKYLGFGPDARLYLNVGAPCNICLSKDPRFASILRMDPATGTTEVYAHGVRNSVGFEWHPQTGRLWFTDNGRDMLGDDVPPEEVNVVTKPGQHFGYPFVHGASLLDPEFGKGKNPDDYADPVVEIQAHSAALGVDFYTGEQFPQRYRGALFIAEHGSWNRSSKVGYRVSVVTFDGDDPRYAPFVTGWLQGQENWGRPNDVEMAGDGSLLISDDQVGAIYRVTYIPPPGA